MTLDKLSLAPVIQFYHQNERKIILLLTLLISLYLIAFVAKLTWQLVPLPNTNNLTAPSLSTSTLEVRAVDTKNKLQSLLALNLFGDVDAQPEAVVEEDVTDAPETKLNLLLSGVVASSDPRVGAAIIEYRNAQNTYGIGDKIEGTQVTLDEIYSDRVIIKNRTSRETLMLDGVDFEEANRLRMQNQAITSQPVSSQTANTPRPDPNQARIDADVAERIKDARSRLQAGPANFTDFIRLSPHAQDGIPIGYRISPGRDPQLFQEVGLQEGDIITELNGYDLSDVRQGIEALNELNSAQSIDLEIIRKDEFISLSVEIPQE